MNILIFLNIVTVTLLIMPCQRLVANEADRWIGIGDERHTLFDEYVATIKDGQVVSALGFQRLGTTWEDELARAQMLFMQAKQRDDVYYALVALHRSFHDAHSSLRTPRQLVPQSAPVHLPFMLHVHGRYPGRESYIVTDSHHSDIHPGFLLQRYDGHTP
ncbi:MAG: hypothetical protein GY801_52255, partial [bacterium]|nr:hypothetical protein [bacterium]